MAATAEMLNMSKEELIAKIAEADKHGRELESGLRELVDMRNKLVEEADKLRKDIEHGIGVMEALAMAKAEIDKLLAEKYGSIVM